MQNRKRCVVCDSLDTNHLHVEQFSYMIEIVRGCENCQSQFINEYSLCDRYELETDE
jgi:hypothetical protein